MTTENEPDMMGFSPDLGPYVRRGTKYYDANGGVYEQTATSPERRTVVSVAFRVSVDSERVNTGLPYATWTDEERAAAAADAKRRYEAACDAATLREAERERLRDSARAKLTEEEYRAVAECDC